MTVVHTSRYTTLTLFVRKTQKHFGIKIEFTFPDEQQVTDLVNEKGMFSFLQDGHKECCGVRKVKPLRKKLRTLKAWVTGQRKDQSPGTRAAVPAIQVDPVFEGKEGGAGSLVKFNPLTNASSQEVWDFLRVMGTPVNKVRVARFPNPSHTVLSLTRL